MGERETVEETIEVRHDREIGRLYRHIRQIWLKLFSSDWKRAVGKSPSRVYSNLPT